MIVFRSVFKIREYDQKIKESIGALINSGGGVILFGCYNKNKEIICNG